MSEHTNRAVLSERLRDLIGNRRVKAAVFTTFSFDPGFFELHVLPTLFDFPFHHAEKVKRLQLEDQLQGVDDVSVYYDTTALLQDAMPAQLDFRRIGVRIGTGVFHPKLVMLLVESIPEDQDETEKETSLIFGTLSANLTRSGWWENVEVAEFEELKDKDDSNEVFTFRDDVFELVKHLRKLGDSNHQPALDSIYDFVRYRTSTRTRASVKSSSGNYYPRVFYGQKQFSDWLADVKLAKKNYWNLEVVSPFFDADANGALRKLIETLDPVETRIFLPQADDGSALVSEELYQSVEEEDYVSWADLPDAILRRANADTTRRVHAKVYRLWHYQDDLEVTISGSVNLTRAGHSKLKAGNFEASFLTSGKEVGRKRWLLPSLEAEPVDFAERSELVEDDCQQVHLDLRIRFDWNTREAAYWIGDDNRVSMQICGKSGKPLFEFAPKKIGQWVKFRVEESELLESLLLSTSFVLIKHDLGQWRILIQEESVVHRPSVLSELTPEEILLYWSLLTDSQKAAFVEERIVASGEGELEGLSQKSFRYLAKNTLFDRFSGIFHAFQHLLNHVSECLENERLKEAEARLLGAKYDSLPELLRKTLEDNDDAVLRYIIFLCAQQVADQIATEYPQFWNSHRKAIQRLSELLGQRETLADELPIEDGDKVQFLQWYEEMFLGQPDRVGV